MASPRIFVSSTCYDLHEIRHQLRQFISDFGFEPVMSDFEDIFYNRDLHVQESCLEEIPKCHFFILIIGNNYGSIYYRDKNRIIPDSVTLREFRKSIEIKIFKHICINRFVDYDYKNYKRALEKQIVEHFKSSNVPEMDIDNTKKTIKENFDQTFPFPQESYRYIFYFLDIIYELKENNGIHLFETFNDLKNGLRKQWAGLVHEALTKKEKMNNAIISQLGIKVDHLDKKISQLLEVKTIEPDNKFSIDVNSILRSSTGEQFEEFRNRIDSLLNTICQYQDSDNWGNEFYQTRITFQKRFTTENLKDWFEYLGELVQSYKWSKRIDVQVVFKNFSIQEFDKVYSEINYQTIFELYSLFNSLSESEKINLLNTVADRLNKNCIQIPASTVDEVDHGLPF